MIAYVISMSLYNVAADNVVRQLPYLLGRVGRLRRGLGLWLVTTTMTRGGITKSCEKEIAGTNVASTYINQSICLISNTNLIQNIVQTKSIKC